MRRIGECLIVELKLLYRKRLMWICIPLFLLYALLLPITTSSIDSMYTFYLNTYLLMAGMLFTMLLGYNLINNEDKHSCEELFSSIPQGKKYKVYGKLSAILLIILLLNLLILFINFMFYIFYGTPLVFYIEGFKFMLLYFVLSCAITGILGMIIGILIKKRAAYFLILVFWLLFGPSRDIVYFPIFRILKIQCKNFLLADFLNLMPIDAGSIPPLFYGYPLELTRWYHKGMLLFTLLLLLSLLVIIKSYKVSLSKLSVPIVMLLGAVICTMLYFQPSQILYLSKEYNSQKVYDPNYYRSTKYEAAEAKFLVSTYNIDLNVGRILKAKVDMEYKALEPIDLLEFTLYRDLKITKAEGEGPLNFIQNGDYVTISLKNPLNVGSTGRITIYYEGTTSPYFFANECAVELPYYYSWIPREGKYALMSTGGYCYHQFNEADFSLHFTGTGPVYTNLKPSGENFWKGRAQGITLIASPWVRQTQVGESYIFYPSKYYNMTSKVEGFYKKSLAIRQRMMEDFEFPINKEAYKKVYIVTDPDILISYHRNHEASDHVLLGCDIFYVPDSSKKIINAYLSSFSAVKDDEQMDELYSGVLTCYEYWYMTRYEPEDINSCDIIAFQSRKDVGEFYKALQESMDVKMKDPHTVKAFFMRSMELLKNRGSVDNFIELLREGV